VICASFGVCPSVVAVTCTRPSSLQHPAIERKPGLRLGKDQAAPPSSLKALMIVRESTNTYLHCLDQPFDALGCSCGCSARVRKKSA